MTDTPTPAQQLEEVLAAFEQASTPDAIQLAESDCSLYLIVHAPTLRRALAALEAVEKARKRFIVWGGAEGYVTDDEDDAEFARCGFRATASTSVIAEAMREGYADGADDEETELHCETVLIIPADAVEVKS